MIMILYTSLLLFIQYSLCSLPALHVEEGTGKIINSDNEEVILHGVNVVYKVDPWIPELEKWDPLTSFTSKDMNLLQVWGFNVVRLGVMWPGVCKRSGIDREYLKKIEYIITELGKRGIYTVIDMHQDLLSK